VASSPLSKDLLEDLGRAGDEVWKRHRDRRGGAFHGFVPADHQGAHEALVALRERADNFVELGAGAGVITIVADLLGFDAYGIEIEPWLVEAATDLAERFGSSATFVEGSFFPRGFDAVGLQADADFHVTYDAAPSAWDELGLELDDFDLVYAYPWPGEEPLFERLLRAAGRRGATFLRYAADEGFSTVAID